MRLASTLLRGLAGVKRNDVRDACGRLCHVSPGPSGACVEEIISFQRSTRATATMLSGSPASCRPVGSRRYASRISTATRLPGPDQPIEFQNLLLDLAQLNSECQEIGDDRKQLLDTVNARAGGGAVHSINNAGFRRPRSRTRHNSGSPGCYPDLVRDTNRHVIQAGRGCLMALARWFE
jgi:hypothetical protein